MRTRKSLLGRQTRNRKSLLLLSAAISISVGGTANAQEAELAYYAPHRSESKNQVIMVSSADGSFHSILQTQAVLPQAPERLPQAPERLPRTAETLPQTLEVFPQAQGAFPPNPLTIQDDAIPSSSDVPAGGTESTLPAPLGDPVGDYGAIVDQELVPAPIEQPIRGIIDEEFPAQLAAPVTTRPTLGSVAGSYSSAPNMIGDFFGGTFLVLGRTAALAGGDRRFKIAENVSPVPQDRVFFNYNHFENSLRDVNGVTRSLDRFTFGFEKTFFRGMASFEMRLPFASGLNSRQSIGVTDTQSTELGNLAFAFKTKLMSGCDWVLSAGTTLTIATGDDFEVSGGNTGGLRIENDAVHMAPFIGYLTQPNRCWFAQGFIQADFDLNGNDVFTGANGLEGVLQDQNLLFIDASIGRWIHRSCDPCDRLAGVAAIAELHYTSTMNDTDDVARVTNPFNRMDILNASAALHFQFRKTSLRVGGAAPLREDEERLFDAEIIVQLNRNY